MKYYINFLIIFTCLSNLLAQNAGNAISLDGDWDYVNVPHSSIFDFQNQFTIITQSALIV